MRKPVQSSKPKQRAKGAAAQGMLGAQLGSRAEQSADLLAAVNMHGPTPVAGAEPLGCGYFGAWIISNPKLGQAPDDVQAQRPAIPVFLLGQLRPLTGQLSRQRAAVADSRRVAHQRVQLGNPPRPRQSQNVDGSPGSIQRLGASSGSWPHLLWPGLRQQTQVRQVHMSVNRGGVELAVAQHVGHLFEAGSVLDQMTGQSVAQQMSSRRGVLRCRNGATRGG